MYGKSNMETYITICKIDSKQEFAVWLRKLTTRGMGWGGKWREVQEGGDMYVPIADWC